MVLANALLYGFDHIATAAAGAAESHVHGRDLLDVRSARAILAFLHICCRGTDDIAGCRGHGIGNWSHI